MRIAGMHVQENKNLKKYVKSLIIFDDFERLQDGSQIKIQPNKETSRCYEYSLVLYIFEIEFNQKVIWF